MNIQAAFGRLRQLARLGDETDAWIKDGVQTVIRRYPRQPNLRYDLLTAAALIAVGHGCAAVMPPDPDVRYVAFGDSTTRGAVRNGYVEQLPPLVGQPQSAFVNEGHGGETTDEGLLRLGEILDAVRYPNAIAWFYWEGGNDLIEFMQSYDPLLEHSPQNPTFAFTAELNDQLDDTQANIESAIATLRQAGMVVFVATVFFVNSDTATCPPLQGAAMTAEQAEHANAYVVLLNERIRTAVDRQNAVLVDTASINEALLAAPANYADCNHLSEKGSLMAAQAFAEAMMGITD